MKKKTAFLTRHNLFEYMIMPFEFCNAPSIFQVFINEILREHLNDFCSTYLNDILIYSNSKEKYIEYIKTVLEKLK